MPSGTPRASTPVAAYSPRALDAAKREEMTARSFMYPGSLVGTGLRAEAAAFLTANGADILRMCPLFLTFPAGEKQLGCLFASLVMGRKIATQSCPAQFSID